MDLLAVDYGGTRTKVGRFIDGELVEVNVFPSPDKWTDMLDQVKKYYNGEEVGFSLQGPVPLSGQGVWQYGLASGSKRKHQVDLDLFREELTKRGFREPKLIVADPTVQAFGVVGNGAGLVGQLSTGVALKLIVDRELCVGLNNDPLFYTFSQDEKYKIMNQEKTFYQWLRSENLKEWINSTLRDLDWQERVLTEHRDLYYIANIFTNMVLRAYQKSPIKNPDVYLVGGGALALKRYLQKDFKDLGIPVKFADDAETTPLKGIYSLAKNGLRLKQV